VHNAVFRDVFDIGRRTKSVEGLLVEISLKVPRISANKEEMARLLRTSKAIDQLPVVGDGGASLQLAKDGRLGHAVLELDDVFPGSLAVEPLNSAQRSWGCKYGRSEGDSGEDSGEETHSYSGALERNGEGHLR
jgi:hypothetical protein